MIVKNFSLGKHIFLLTFFIVLLSTFLAILFLKVSFTPPGASSLSYPLDRLLSILFSIGAVIFAICFVALVYSVIAFRRRPGDMGDGPPWHAHTPTEALWALVPLAIVIFVGTYGALVLRDITQPSNPGEELEIRVTAMKWSWRFEYPEYKITSNDLKLPVKAPVLFKLTSKDVVHSLWVPEFRVKMDAVPGMETHLRVTPTRVGQYKLLCAELCGLAHTVMLAPVQVMEREDFEKWARK